MRKNLIIIASQFSPAESVLGRWLKIHTGDSRQAESTYIAVAGISAVVLLLIHFFVWSMNRPADPDAQNVLAAVELLVLAVYVVLTFVGRRPRITVQLETSALRVSRRGDAELVIPYEDIEAVGRTDARTFHRHYRRYAETLAFVNRIPDELLLLTWNGVPVVLGVPESELEAVERAIEQRAPVAHASSRVDAA